MRLHRGNRWSGRLAALYNPMTAAHTPATRRLGMGGRAGSQIARRRGFGPHGTKRSAIKLIGAQPHLPAALDASSEASPRCGTQLKRGAYMADQQHHDADVKQLHSMGYAQELSRRMGLFQNFAISFSIICILAGGITAFPLSLSGAGGASLGLGWPLATIFALLVACALGQVASAYPTAGGIYHWASMLGNKTYGWIAAWLNLFGLMFVVSSVNFGVFFLFRDLFLGDALGMDVSGWTPAAAFDHGWWVQTLFITGITIAQALINHYGIKLTTVLTDIAGYIIFVGSVILIIALLVNAPSFEISRLFTFKDYTGDAGGGVWVPPASDRWLASFMPAVGVAFYLALLQGVYTITGFDASGHTSEETRSAATEVPKGMIH